MHYSDYHVTITNESMMQLLIMAFMMLFVATMTLAFLYFAWNTIKVCIIFVIITNVFVYASLAFVAYPIWFSSYDVEITEKKLINLHEKIDIKDTGLLHRIPTYKMTTRIITICPVVELLGKENRSIIAHCFSHKGITHHQYIGPDRNETIPSSQVIKLGGPMKALTNIGAVFSREMIKQLATIESILRLDTNCAILPPIPFISGIFKSENAGGGINICMHHLLEIVDIFVSKCVNYLNKLE